MKVFFPLFLLITLGACSSRFAAVSYRYNEQKIDSAAAFAPHIEEVISPYRDSLDKEMNVVLAVADDALTRNQPQSDLGNWMCDVILKKSIDYYGAPVDFTFLNNGGIRIPSLPKGGITYGKMIELMPFENRLVIMKLKGTTVDSLFNHMAAKGGWHISGARYKIKNGTAVNVIINGLPLNANSTYTVAVSDYLAQGGDNCNMLKGIPYIGLKQTLRDALIDGLKETAAKGEHIKSIMDGRIELMAE